MANPSIDELNDNGKFELIAELSHENIKEFVFEQLAKGGKLVVGFMIYQVIMLVLGGFILTRSIVLSFHGEPVYLYFSLGALLFCFTLLVPVHELLHGAAIKLTGAKKVHYGAYFRKFLFYAEADQHVINRGQFEWIALTPLFVVKILTLGFSVTYFHSPILFSLLVVMSTHSFFCAGDVGLLSVFYHSGNDEVYTYDVRAEKKSFYFKRK